VSNDCQLWLSSCLVGPCRRKLGERVGDAEARTCASSSPSQCGTELARIPPRCLTAAAWPNVDARHPNCLANCFCPSARPCASPAHRHETGCLRKGRGQGHGSLAEVMAHGPRRLQHGAHLRCSTAPRVRLNGNRAELVTPLGSRWAGTADRTAVRTGCAAVLRVTIIEPMNRRPQSPVLACVPCSSSTGPSDQ